MVEQTLTLMDPLPPLHPPSTTTNSCLEIRLFYIRITSSSPSSTPPSRLLLTHHSNSTIHINGVPSSPASLPLRLDRLDRAAGEATYVSTDSVRLSASDFEVATTLDDDDPSVLLLLRGKFELMDSSAADRWAISCRAAAEAPAGSVVEVYVAGCYKGSPVILTRTVKMGLKRNGLLDAIPEEEKRLAANDTDADDNDTKLGPNYCPEGWYSDDDDGQLSWFNAGVRVGVGIGLGVCVGLGIGVGLFMRSYQATTRNFKRRFL